MVETKRLVPARNFRDDRTANVRNQELIDDECFRTG